MTERREPGIGAVGRAGRRPELVDLEEALLVRVVDAEAPRARVVARERHRQQAALAAGRDAIGDVEERPPELASALNDPDRSLALDDEAAPVAARSREVGRLVEAAEPQEPHRALLGGAAGWSLWVLTAGFVAIVCSESPSLQPANATSNTGRMYRRALTQPQYGNANLRPVGLWRSLVARSVRVGEVAGSNPVSPTRQSSPHRFARRCGDSTAQGSSGLADLRGQWSASRLVS